MQTPSGPNPTVTNSDLHRIETHASQTSNTANPIQSSFQTGPPPPDANEDLPEYTRRAPPVAIRAATGPLPLHHHDYISRSGKVSLDVSWDLGNEY